MPPKKSAPKKPAKPKPARVSVPILKAPRHSVQRALRIPRAILEQNAGKECSIADAASYLGMVKTKAAVGDFGVEISSASKYKLLDRPSSGRLAITDLARKILRPQNPEDELAGLRQAVLNAPDIGDVYRHYRGENLPDDSFLRNALVDNFKVPEPKVNEFLSVFFECLEDAQLIEKHGDKRRILDISQEKSVSYDPGVDIQRLGRGVSISDSDSCFVVMPFALPLGAYFASIYEPAIKKAGLHPIRADDDIFSTGKIMDQVWLGINQARVLVAELTGRNPNVFYELGLAHALRKPVVLVSSNEEDVPFDVRHIRVIYYDMTDPFWGEKLINKVAENILSALKNPEEAIFSTSR
jgi:hypothetical protein